MTKLLIIGNARHGKDTAAEYLRDVYGYSLSDSSRKALEIFLLERLQPKYGYTSVDEAYADRVNHRAEWYDEITAFNMPDRAKLAKLILLEADIYVGMRNALELQACREQRVFDLVVWIDASKRLPPEPSSSMTITADMADVILDNNGPQVWLGTQLDMLAEYLRPGRKS